MSLDPEILAQINDPDVLRAIIAELSQKSEDLEERLKALEKLAQSKPEVLKVIKEKIDRLEIIRHQVIDSERMSRPYLLSPELKAISEVVDILANAGDCNSIVIEGEPGTGKTQWAYYEAGKEIAEGKDTILIHVRVKENMSATDLLYNIDNVRRLNDAQSHDQVPPEIKQRAGEWLQKIQSGEIDPATSEEYKEFKTVLSEIKVLSEVSKDLDYADYVDLGPLGEAIYQSSKGKKVYLLIDEIEKGREELMTGILDEIENLTFKIGETGQEIKGDKKNMRIVITTNTEDSDKIPTSFRRRSLYHFIDYPDRNLMADIVKANYNDIRQELLDYALETFYKYHESTELRKKPSTPELLSWIRVLIDEDIGMLPEDIPHKEILLKFKDDLELDIARLEIEVKEQREKKAPNMPSFVQRALKGEKVYFIDSKFNTTRQGNTAIYADLHNAGIAFSTPITRNEERDDDDGEGVYEIEVCDREFMIITPGIDNLGEGYYSVPEDMHDKVKPVLGGSLRVLEAPVDFIEVANSNATFKRGTVKIEDKDYGAYLTNEGKMVIIDPYNA